MILSQRERVLQPRNPKTPQQGVPTAKKESHGATASKKVSPIYSYADNHKKVAKQSILRLFKNPVATLMNWLVVGIAISFPAASLLLLTDLEQISGHVDDGNQITLFLKPVISEERANKLVLALSQKPQVASIDYVSKEQALLQLQEISGFEDALSLLDENPLPGAIVVVPSRVMTTSSQVKSFGEELKRLPEVDRVQMDIEWVQRLFTLMELVSRVFIVVGALFILAVILVISNTIRLAIENRRDEITVVKLVGGTDSFVRRPFLYMGLWFGGGGTLIATIFIEIGFSWLNEPITTLATSYGSDFRLSGLNIPSFLLLLFVGMFLGWLGARHAVRRHLKAIEP